MKREGKLTDETKWIAYCCHLTCNVDLSASPTGLCASEKLTNGVLQRDFKKCGGSSTRYFEHQLL